MGVLEPWFELRSKDISESLSMSFRSMLEKVIKPPLVARERLERDTSVVSIPPGIPLTVVPAILSIARLSTLLKGGAASFGHCQSFFAPCGCCGASS